MKKIIFGLVLLALFNACTKEQIPAGLILAIANDIKDSTYLLTSVPPTQSKRVLIEEATGVHCANCPAGTALVGNLKVTHPDRIVATAVFSPLLNYVQSPSKYDFNSNDALSLVTMLGGDPAKPTAAIDRLETGSAYPYFFDLTTWAGTVTTELTKTTPVNLDLQIAPTGNTDQYRLKTVMTFTDTLTADLNLSVYLLEDQVIDYQDSLGVPILNYLHDHILRTILTPLPGSSVLSPTNSHEKGRVSEKTITFTLPKAVMVNGFPQGIVDKTHLKLAVFIHKTGSSREVLQAAEIALP